MNTWTCIASLISVLPLLVTAPTATQAAHSHLQPFQQEPNRISADSTERAARGLWPIQNIAASEYAAQRGNASIGHAQNWATVQGPDGLIYAGNAEGVLVFDGVRWTAVPIAAEPLSGRGRMASALAVRRDTVFVGSRGTFGYLAPDARGQLQYISLLDAVPEGERTFDRVWSVTAGRTGVYFLTDRRLFRWANGTVTMWTPNDFVAPEAALPDGDPDDRFFFLSHAVRGTPYVQIRGVGLMRIDGDTLRLAPDGARFAGDGIYALLPYDEDRLLVGTRTMGLFLHDGRRATPFATDADAFLNENQLYHGARLPDGTFALATRRGGVLVLDRTGRALRVIDAAVGLRDDMVRHVQVDREGGLWMALNDGLARVEVGASYERFGEPLGLSGEVMAATRHEGTLYVGTQAGLFRLQPDGHGPLERYGRFERIDGFGAACTALLSTEVGLLAAVGRVVYAVRGTAVQRVTADMGATALALHRSRQDADRVYIGLRNGLAALTLDGTRWQDEGFVSDLDAPIGFLTEDATGTLWGAADTHGLYRIQSPGTAPAVTRFDATRGLPPLIDHRVFALDGRLAVGTRRGLYRYAAEADRFIPDTTFGTALAGGNNVFITHLTASSEGAVWLRAAEEEPDGDKRIVRFASTDAGYAPRDTLHRLRETVVRELFVDDDRGNVWSGAVGSWGPLVRYRTGGHRSDAPPPVTAAVRHVQNLDRDTLLFGGVHAPDWTPPRLPYEASGALRFAYAAPHYTAAQTVRYQTWLAGFEDGWSDWTTETQRDYTNLPEGTYTFRVRARDVYGRRSQHAGFTFTVLPPWYRTMWAYGLYGLLALAVMAGAVRWRSARLRARTRRLEAEVAARTTEVARQKDQLEVQNTRLEEQAVRLAALDEAKSRFFANLSHEFRTPLTLILGPIEDLLAGAPEESNDTETLHLVHRNASRLLRLINQLMDLAKLEAGHMQLEAARIDAAAFLQSITRAFVPLAERRGIDLTFAAEEPPKARPLYADRDKLEKVMANLLSNAFKATPDGGRIDVRLHRDDDHTTLVVEDTGRGIPSDEQAAIFDRFQQHDDASIEPGTGIGLNLVKEFVELHGGTIGVDSTPGDGTTFTVRLPLGRSHLRDEDIVDAPARRVDEEVAADGVSPSSDVPGEKDGEAPTVSDEDVPTLLIVDDNPDIRAYVREQMGARYRVAEAADGVEGLARAEAALPDCIIADVMMPRMDGYALAEALKADPDLDHVPLILLTAKADSEHRIEGLETGADDYLTKPFNARELVARVDNLIASRHRLREKFSRGVTLKPSAVDVESADEAFLRQVRGAVEAHLTDPDFRVEQLAEAVALSPSQLQRKVKALTEQTPVQVIRAMRLERAAQLLDQEAGTISEIAYAVGFNSYSHFARSFKQHFGRSASAYRDR